MKFMSLLREKKACYLTLKDRESQIISAGSKFDVDMSVHENVLAMIILMQSQRVCPADYPETVEVNIKQSFFILTDDVRYRGERGDIVTLPRKAAVFVISHDKGTPVDKNLWHFQMPVEEPAEIRKLYSDESEGEKSGSWVTKWRRR